MTTFAASKSYNTMKNTLLFTLALVSVMLMGCSKSEDNIGNLEAGQALTKDQIVGVWRNGDSWVSFSEDGVVRDADDNSVYFSYWPVFYDGHFYGYLNINGQERICSSICYIIKDDTILIYDSDRRRNGSYEPIIAKCSINNVSETSLDITMYRDSIEEWSMSFAKGQEEPCGVIDGLEGRQFVFDKVYDGVKQTYNATICNNDREFHQVYYTNKNEDGNAHDDWGYFYYVYLSPYIYMSERLNGKDEAAVIKGRLSDGDDEGSFVYEPAD